MPGGLLSGVERLRTCTSAHAVHASAREGFPCKRWVVVSLTEFQFREARAHWLFDNSSLQVSYRDVSNKVLGLAARAPKLTARKPYALQFGAKKDPAWLTDLILCFGLGFMP